MSVFRLDDFIEEASTDKNMLRIACALLTECEAAIGCIDPECESEARAASKLRAQIVDFLADAGV